MREMKASVVAYDGERHGVSVTCNRKNGERRSVSATCKIIHIALTLRRSPEYSELFTSRLQLAHAFDGLHAVVAIRASQVRLLVKAIGHAQFTIAQISLGQLEQFVGFVAHPQLLVRVCSRSAPRRRCFLLFDTVNGAADVADPASARSEHARRPSSGREPPGRTDKPGKWRAHLTPSGCPIFWRVPTRRWQPGIALRMARTGDLKTALFPLAFARLLCICRRVTLLSRLVSQTADAGSGDRRPGSDYRRPNVGGISRHGNRRRALPAGTKDDGFSNGPSSGR